MNPVALKSAVRIAQERGFSFILNTFAGIHQPMDEFLDEIEDGGPEEYVLFGNIIIRITDAWKEDHEQYGLE